VAVEEVEDVLGVVGDGVGGLEQRFISICFFDIRLRFRLVGYVAAETSDSVGLDVAGTVPADLHIRCNGLIISGL
jgi:hypothetical protein